MRPRPTFHDQSLQQALDQAASVFEASVADLDKLSSDIKTLEHYLQQSPIRQRVIVPFHDGTEGLSWQQGDPDRWRIVYLPGSEQARPRLLIECPAAIRLRAREVLPDLLRAVAMCAFVREGDAP